MPLRQSGHRVLQVDKPRRSPVKTLAMSLYILLVVLSAIVVGLYVFWNLRVKTPEIPQRAGPEPVSNQTPRTPVTPAADPQEASLPAGPQRREGVYTVVLLGKDMESGNTDSIILVTYDTLNQKAGMVSIPRDTIVRRDWSRNLKINAAYAMQGADTLKAELENTFGIPVDFYVWINLKGFIALVDQLGGVDVYIPINMNYDDPEQNLHIHYAKGQHHLTGQQAMEVARFRHNNEKDGGGGYNDEGRAQMQRTILMALVKKVLSWNSLTKVQSFLDIFQKYVKTDLSTEEMLYFASQAIYLDPSADLRQGALEGRGDGIYQGNRWCYVFEAEDILPTLNELLNPYDTDLTAEDLDLLKADRFYFN